MRPRAPPIAPVAPLCDNRETMAAPELYYAGGCAILGGWMYSLVRNSLMDIPSRMLASIMTSTCIVAAALLVLLSQGKI